MSYLDYINAFWKLDEVCQFSGCETRLYFYLLKTANCLGWMDNFSYSDNRLSANIGVANDTMKRARNRLLQSELISIKPGGNGQKDKTRYSILVPKLVPNQVPKLVPNQVPKLAPNQVPKLAPLNRLRLREEKNIKEKNATGGIPKENDFSFANSLSLLNVKDDVLKEFLANRKRKKMPNTQRVFDSLLIETEKAGISVAAAVEYAVNQGWASFKADWYIKEKGGGSNSNGLHDYSWYSKQAMSGHGDDIANVKIGENCWWYLKSELTPEQAQELANNMVKK